MDKVNMVPGFILKLWNIINDHRCDNLISWSDDGQSFIIQNQAEFTQELSKYFKHNNLSSFIRQLNMYGFRKVVALENSGLHQGSDDLHFFHPDFVRNKPERLEAIKRKLPQKVADSVDLNNVMKGIAEIEDKQKNTTMTLSELRRENEMLWAELRDLREKHEQQQIYLSGLMKLMMAALEQSDIPHHMLKSIRNQPLMIEANEDANNQSSYPTTSNININPQESVTPEQPTGVTTTINNASVVTPTNIEPEPIVELNYDPTMEYFCNMEENAPPAQELQQQERYIKLQENIENTGDQIDALVGDVLISDPCHPDPAMDLGLFD